MGGKRSLRGRDQSRPRIYAQRISRPDIKRGQAAPPCTAQ